ncbi:hypothetical protein XA68_16511 [Ophiocordyceps unilateralis]|uniref:Uncharacterized protein n=1 Tax=Ophiocordyceps unilateralis TaxID=268505 RepID=A0A2A9PKZ7_OPHUN|nr:hypothetical protein XA68_16511 [Ophiocordyceps unilateralis]
MPRGDDLDATELGRMQPLTPWPCKTGPMQCFRHSAITFASLSSGAGAGDNAFTESVMADECTMQSYLTASASEVVGATADHWKGRTDSLFPLAIRGAPIPAVLYQSYRRMSMTELYNKRALSMSPPYAHTGGCSCCKRGSYSNDLICRKGVAKRQRIATVFKAES